MRFRKEIGLAWRAKSPEEKAKYAKDANAAFTKQQVEAEEADYLKSQRIRGEGLLQTLACDCGDAKFPL